jgi:hypothetical protein
MFRDYPEIHTRPRILVLYVLHIVLVPVVVGACATGPLILYTAFLRRWDAAGSRSEDLEVMIIAILALCNQSDSMLA